MNEQQNDRIELEGILVELVATEREIDQSKKLIAKLLAGAKQHFITNGEYTRGDAGRFYRWAKKQCPDFNRYYINKMVAIGELMLRKGLA
jgi:hypothetical protein